MDNKYFEMLYAIYKSIQENMKAAPECYPHLFTKTVGYKINLPHSPDWFDKIDWLESNGYIKIERDDIHKMQWCDITESYWETYSITDKGMSIINK